MASEKTQVIEYIFLRFWDEKSKKLKRSLITLNDVQEAIRHCNKAFNLNLSDRNPANFMKDIVRGQSASVNWPERLKKLQYTAVQRPGAGNVFEFVKYEEDQTEPFPDTYKPTENTPRFSVQSVSMPLAAKQLGRSDEPWLIQTAVNLRVIETHLAIVSAMNVVELSHLQMSVKLRETEIDALFLAICEDGSGRFEAIVTCEAKQARERILEHQIVNQVKAAFEETSVDVVIPLGLRAVKPSGFYVVEFRAIKRGHAKSLTRLDVAKDAVYSLKPPVSGI